jgi:glycosyltransferase involved in cell wall biosynthesis
MNEEPLVSVIIPTYNRKNKVLEAIESVVVQNIPNMEILVVDDGSTDGTAEFLKSKDLPISIIKKENGGVSSARNAGIKASKAKYLAFLDSDDLWLEGKLSAQLAYFNDHPEASLIYTDQYINVDGQNLDQTRFQRQVPRNKMSFPGFVDLTPIHISTVILKREVLNTVGTFNETLRVHEDSELWNRISDRYRLDFIEEILGVYRWESKAEHVTSAKNQKKFLQNGRKYLELYRGSKNRALTPEEEEACRKSEKILNEIEKELNIG